MIPMLIDDIDRRILEILKSNARTSFREVSRRLGVSTPTVAARVRKLEDLGVIRGYTLRLRADPSRGTMFFFETGGRTGRLRRRLEGIDGVSHIIPLAGGRVVVIAEHRAKGPILALAQETGAEVRHYRITSSPRRYAVRALCAFCRRPMEDAIRLTLGGRRYYVCCPVCMDALKERYRTMRRAKSDPSGERS